MMSDIVASAAEEVEKASTRIDGKVYKTPLQRALWLEKNDNGNKVFLKLESEQITGSFKVRGATNKVLSLDKDSKERGIITASTGNHALAVTHACQALNDPNVKFQVVLPETASTAKVEHLKALGAPVKFFGKDCLVAEMEAIRDSKENNKTYISPYNDLQVLAGQGTIAKEILEQLATEKPDFVFVPVGGGGLIAGIASYLSKASPDTKVIGCGPKNDAHMGRSIAAGELLKGDGYLENDGLTISEGTAGAVEDGSVTFPICQKAVHEWLELTEEEIGLAVVDMLDKHHKAVEGAAGLGIAGFRRKESEMTGKTVVIVICGGNCKASQIKDLLNTHLNN